MGVTRFIGQLAPGQREKPKVMVTGASGFLGTQITKALVKQGFAVHATYRDHSALTRLRQIGIRNVMYSPDLFSEDKSWWSNRLRGFFGVIHAAWFTDPGRYLEAPENLDALRGSINLAIGAADAQVSRFVGVGSCFEYDLSSGPASTVTALKPQSLYAAAKVALFHLLSEALRTSETSFVWARPFYLYGPGEHPERLFPYLNSRLRAGQRVNLTDGTQIRDYLQVGAAGDLIARLISQDLSGPVNVCSGEGVSVRSFAENIADNFGRRDLLTFGARERNQFDPDFAVGIPTVF